MVYWGCRCRDAATRLRFVRINNNVAFLDDKNSRIYRGAFEPSRNVRCDEFDMYVSNAVK